MEVNPTATATNEQGEVIIKTLNFKILRFNPDHDAKPYVETFTVPVVKGMTVLEGLVYIKEHLDGSLVWRSSCRMGVCGSCGMFINSLPRLACQTQILELEANTIHIKPLPNYDILRDLIPDLMPMIEKHRSVQPFLIRHNENEINNLTGEFFQTAEELENYIQFSFCIKCGLCLAACPTVATDDEYLGPQALGQLFRYATDSRDEGSRLRYDLIDSSAGPWRCHFAGTCSDVCPKGVDPGFAIQLLKRDILLNKLHLQRKPHGAAILPPLKEGERRPEVPEAPQRTV